MYCEKYVEMGRKIRYYRIMQELGQGADRHYSAVFEQNRARQRAPEYGPGVPHRR